MNPLDFSKSQKLITFSSSWIPTLVGWIKNPEDLVYWAGNTFLGQGFSPQSFKMHLKDKNIFPYSKLDSDGNLVAYGEIVRKNKENRLNLCRIIVHPEKRSRGIGKLFCISLIEKSISLGSYESLRLNVLSKNKPALHCYTSLGFKTIGVIPKARRVGHREEDLIIMSKKL